MIQVVVCAKSDCECNGFNNECYSVRVELDQNGKCLDYKKASVV